MSARATGEGEPPQTLNTSSVGARVEARTAEFLAAGQRRLAEQLARLGHPAPEGWDIKDSATAGEGANAQTPCTPHGSIPPAVGQIGAAELARDARILAIVGMPQPLAREVAAQVGTLRPVLEATEQSAREREQREAAEEEARLNEHALQVARAQIGQWTKDSAARLEQMQPSTPAEVADAKKLTPHVWAVCRLASCGGLNDLAYAVQQMALCVPDEVLGCWVVFAMGMRADGTALRQLYTPKARRLLVRCFALWSGGHNMRLRQIAGSPSRRTVRGVKRLPQTLLARLAAIGGKRWHRSTTTRDAGESHTAGLWHRVRLPRDKAHPSERCGPSEQVVSRYWMELPKLRVGRRDDPPATVGAVAARSGVESSSAHSWVRQHAKQAIRYAVRAVEIIRRAGDFVAVPALMHPLQAADPPT